jgi:hypothetical protein
MRFLERLLLLLTGFLIGGIIFREPSKRAEPLTPVPEQRRPPQPFPDVPITWPHAKMTLASPVGENTPAGQLRARILCRSPSVDGV